MATTTSPVATENVRRAGCGSSLPARSRLFTSKVCDPGARPLIVAEAAAENGENAPPSIRQANARLDAGVRLSDPAKVKVAAGLVIVPSGPPVIWVSGGVLSTMTVRVAVAAFWP